MDANSICLKNILGGDVLLEVPFFQRKYAWDEPNWDDMWEGIKSLYLDEDKQEYFMGNIIIKRKEASRSKIEYEIIDGQQRLVTLSIILKVLANLCDNPVLKEEINSNIKFKNDKNKLATRIQCSISDRKCYKDLINGEDDDLPFHIKNHQIEGEKHRILGCYSFFKEKIEEDKDLDKKRLKKGEDKFQILSNILMGDLEKSSIRVGHGYLSFVNIALTQDDDEQEIFDTLNSLGKDLSLSDLVKNYLFREKYFGDSETLKESHKEYWKDIFEGDNDNAEWWKQQVFKRGKNSKNNLELFLFCYLVIKSRRRSSDAIRSDEIYREYKRIIDDAVKKKKIQELLKELREYAVIYKDNFTAVDDVESINYEDWNQRLFLTLDLINSISIHPLILFYYHKKDGKEEDKKRFAEEIMSYLIRRMVCNLTGKNYNLLFNDAVYDMGKAADAEFPDFIKKFNVETKRFPDDEDFVYDLLTSARSMNKYWEFILYSIESLIRNNPDSDIDSIKLDGQVEYIIPPNWEETKWYDKNMEIEEKEEQDKYIKTLGNATIVPKKSWKKSWSKEIWKHKRKHLQSLNSFPVLKDYLDNDEWNRDTIRQRAKELKEIALKVWPDILKKKE